jgi:hypothetical protein
MEHWRRTADNRGTNIEAIAGSGAAITRLARPGLQGPDGIVAKLVRNL